MSFENHNRLSLRWAWSQIINLNNTVLHTAEYVLTLWVDCSDSFMICENRFLHSLFIHINDLNLMVSPTTNNAIICWPFQCSDTAIILDWRERLNCFYTCLLTLISFLKIFTKPRIGIILPKLEISAVVGGRCNCLKLHWVLSQMTYTLSAIDQTLHSSALDLEVLTVIWDLAENQSGRWRFWAWNKHVAA